MPRVRSTFASRSFHLELRAKFLFARVYAVGSSLASGSVSISLKYPCAVGGGGFGAWVRGNYRRSARHAERRDQPWGNLPGTCFSTRIPHVRPSRPFHPRAGQIGYAICPRIATGAVLGPEQPVILHMLDIEPAAQALEGVRMELVDAAFPLLHGVVATTDPEVAFAGVDYAILVGGFPRKKGMERKDVMAKNVAIYKSQASALERLASKDVKVVVVANPANTNALILKEHAPSIPPENITCMTRLDHNRALGQLSEKSGVHISKIKNAIIWGNHSSTQYPDVNHATIDGKAAREVINDDAYLDNEFVEVVQQRGAAIINARGLSSALSAGSSACDHIRDWVLGTREGEWVSMGVLSDGSYGAPEGIMFSFPCTCKDGKWEIVQGLTLDERSKEKLRVTGEELVEEKALAMECLGESA